MKTNVDKRSCLCCFSVWETGVPGDKRTAHKLLGEVRPCSVHPSLTSGPANLKLWSCWLSSWHNVLQQLNFEETFRSLCSSRKCRGASISRSTCFQTGEIISVTNSHYPEHLLRCSSRLYIMHGALCFRCTASPPALTVFPAIPGCDGWDICWWWSMMLNQALWLLIKFSIFLSHNYSYNQHYLSCFIICIVIPHPAPLGI